MGVPRVTGERSTVGGVMRQPRLWSWRLVLKAMGWGSGPSDIHALSCIRERIQRRFRAPSIGAFDLLGEIGRDCVGALQFLPEDQEQTSTNLRQVTGERLTNEGVSELLSMSLGSSFPREDDLDDTVRISLAGAQEKTALLFREGGWHRPTGAPPTTHILKLPLGINSQGIDLSTSTENEWLCSEIARAYGIKVPKCWIETFGEYKTLVVERFDRRLSADGSWYLRLPQEDLCQATGTPPALKYESDGGPGIATIMDLLLGSETSAEDRRDFMLTQIVFWMLAAIDGHAKNFRVFLLPAGAFRLTPRYDILSAYPVLGHGRGRLAPEKIRMAMAVRGKKRHDRWKEIRARHWLEMGKRCGFSGMKTIVQEAVAKTPEVVKQGQSIIPAGFPAQIADSILEGIGARAAQLAEEIPI